MGLSIRPGRAEWSYGGFMAFRERLAHLEGIDLNVMQGFVRDEKTRKAAPGKSWQTSAGDDITVLRPLLDHSDCDGYLHDYEAEQMLPRLRAIAADPHSGLPDYDVRRLLALIEGLEHIDQHGCAMVFQ